MRTLPLAEAKSHFSAVIKDVELGNEIAISYGKKVQKRELGTLEGRGSVTFADDWYMTAEDLCKS